MPIKAAIKAIQPYLPDTILSNEQLAQELGEWNAAKIFEKTGIVQRHIAGPAECASDLGFAAAQRLFESGACAPDQIRFVVQLKDCTVSCKLVARSLTKNSPAIRMLRRV